MFASLFHLDNACFKDIVKLKNLLAYLNKQQVACTYQLSFIKLNSTEMCLVTNVIALLYNT